MDGNWEKKYSQYNNEYEMSTNIHDRGKFDEEVGEGDAGQCQLAGQIIGKFVGKRPIKWDCRDWSADQQIEEVEEKGGHQLPRGPNVLGQLKPRRLIWR
jgi:hypothetical protein